ncbi:hypothetical protein [Streptomyces sp. NBC_00199]|uniref:hypothetical protein n=1 Tax=Streptomyces sp. NBC_00199 TaxID=2975678 RepID=UPI002251E2E9|nr:hypothetical protein [Streptomyces sp. NBC_00199]MCX5269217.1 hypothetical protein [Streptomyces sp. NBC_00199]MCX5269773.1 hypothetical protein [Streptomyces sp. NBC_00199]
MSDSANGPVDGVETVEYVNVDGGGDAGGGGGGAALAPRLQSAIPTDLEQLVADISDGTGPAD